MCLGAGERKGASLIWTGFVMDPASPLVTWSVSISQFLGTIFRIAFCLVTRHTPAVSADPETTESGKSRTQKWILSHGQATNYAQTTPVRHEPQELWWQKLHEVAAACCTSALSPVEVISNVKLSCWNHSLFPPILPTGHIGGTFLPSLQQPFYTEHLRSSPPLQLE